MTKKKKTKTKQNREDSEQARTYFAPCINNSSRAKGGSVKIVNNSYNGSNDQEPESFTLEFPITYVQVTRKK